MKTIVTLIALLTLTACYDQHVHEEFLDRAKELCAVNGGVQTLVLTSSIPRGFKNSGSTGWARCHNTARFQFSVVVGEYDSGN
jgi:hypothetical protein